MKLNCFILFCLILTTGCYGHKNITEPYHLEYVDTQDQTTIYYELENGAATGVVPPAIFCVGYNDSYIIAKQHPLSATGGLNKDVTNFFIIPIYKEQTYNPQKGVLGPMNENEFDQILAELEVGQIEFTIEVNGLK